MRWTGAAVGSVVFFALAPGVVTGLVPWWLTGWRMQRPWPYWAPLRVAGVIMLAVGVSVLVAAFARFVVEGAGTPAPTAPTKDLVVGGLYRVPHDAHVPPTGREGNRGVSALTLGDPLGPARSTGNGRHIEPG